MSTFLKYILLFVLLTQTTCICLAQPDFALPLHGIQGKDFWILNYVDHNREYKAITDYNCGNRTYDGHRGTDFHIRSFGAMDSGVYVHAVADGIVAALKDGMYDRSKRMNNNGFGNYIEILHGNYRVTYAHLRKGSLFVKAGDTVKKGQPIAFVGSAGNSVKPHVHLEVTDETKIITIDPFYGDCSKKLPSFWEEQLSYDTSLAVLETMLVPYIPITDSLLDTLQERHLARDTFYTKKDSLFCFYANIVGLKEGDEIRAEWHREVKNRLMYSYTFKWKHNFYLGYIYPYLFKPYKAGKCYVSIYVNNKFLVKRRFYISKEQ